MRTCLDRRVAGARSTLADVAVADAWAQGRTTAEQAVAYALEEDD